MSGYRSEISRLEELARKNLWNEVEAAIRSMNRKSLLDDEVVSLATMARRAYKLSLAILLLKPLVLDLNGQFSRDANPLALSEYAICLTMLGGRKSAERVLWRIPTQCVEGLFAWITLHFSTSSYNDAIPYLKNYIEMVSDSYKKKVGELNLCACLVYTEQYEEALSMLSYLKPYFQSNNHQVLLANSEELEGQIYIRLKNWDKALVSLDSASKLMHEANPLYTLFIKKWQTVCDIHRGEGSMDKVIAICQEAQSLEHFHSVREVAFHWALYNRDNQGLQKVFFGTPFRNYRSYISTKSGDEFTDIYTPWNGNMFFHDWDRSFSIEKSPMAGLSLSKNERRVLEILTSDFFEPMSIGSLFDGLFPDEQMDPDYSIPKTYKVVQRLNLKLISSPSGLRIESNNARYVLKLENGLMVPKVHPELADNNVSSEEAKMISKFANSPFSREELMAEFSLSRATAVRWLKEVEEKGLVNRIGSGPGTFYRINLKLSHIDRYQLKTISY